MVARSAFLFWLGFFESSPVHRYHICSWLVTLAICDCSSIDASDLCGYVPAVFHSSLLLRIASGEHDVVFLHGSIFHDRNLQAGRRDLARHAVSTRRIKKGIGLAILKILFRWDHFAELVSSAVLVFSVVQV